MNFPVTLHKTFHRHGGRIVRITGIEHTTAAPKYGRSQDSWFYRGDVDWNDGTKSRNIEIGAWAACHDNDPQSWQEVLDLSAALSDYLAEHGEWCDSESKHDGWYANERPAKRRRAA